MYTKEQEEIALKEYERLGSVYAVIRRLGYPSKSTLYRWHERRNAGFENRHGHTAAVSEKNDHKCNTPNHPRHPSAEFKYEVLRRCFVNTPPETVPLDRMNGAPRPLKWCMVTAAMVH